jgi:diguanylate cyclase (GGDEF)-like protein
MGSRTSDRPSTVDGRELLRDQLGRVVRHGRGAYLALDVDRFERTHDALGHEVARQLLSKVAQRISQHLSSEELCRRTGDDEFGVVLCNVHSEEDARARVRAILESFRAPFDATTQQVPLTATIGFALVSRGDRTIEPVLNSAERALRRAKEAGGNTFRMGDPRNERESGVLARRRMRLELELGRALQDDQLTPVFTPRLSMDTCKLDTVEVSVRWVHARLGRVPSSELDVVAEDSALDMEVDQWLLKRACSEMNRWQTETLRSARVALSVSARHFRSHDLVPALRGTLSEYGVAPPRLQLQVPDHALLGDGEETEQTLSELRALGVSVVATHEEANCYTLERLARLPLEAVKLDVSVFQGFDAHITSKLMGALTAVLGRRGVGVIADGIRMPSEWQTLGEAGCDFVQGVLIGRPMSSEQLEHLSGDGEQSGVHRRGHSDGPSRTRAAGA